MSDLYCGGAGALQIRASINAVSDVSDLQREAFLQMIEILERDSDHWYPNCVR